MRGCVSRPTDWDCGSLAVNITSSSLPEGRKEGMKERRKAAMGMKEVGMEGRRVRRKAATGMGERMKFPTRMKRNGIL